METKRYFLNNAKYSSCHVAITLDNNSNIIEVKLVSYTTDVIVIKRNDYTGWFVTCTGTYSPTTQRHMLKFCKEFFVSPTMYENIKNIAYNKGYIKLDAVDINSFITVSNKYVFGNKHKRYYGHY